MSRKKRKHARERPGKKGRFSKAKEVGQRILLILLTLLVIGAASSPFISKLNKEDPGHVEEEVIPPQDVPNDDPPQEDEEDPEYDGYLPGDEEVETGRIPFPFNNIE